MSEYGKLGIDYDVLDASKRDAIGFAQSTSHLLDGTAAAPSRARAARRRSCSSSAASTSRSSSRGSARSRSSRAAGWRSPARTASPTSASTPSARSSTTSAASARCRSSSTRTSRPAARTGTPTRPRCSRCSRAGIAPARSSEAAWGGGESPALPDLVSPDDIELAGSAIGLVPAEWGPILGDELRAGDAIVLVDSSGLHANGASLARSVADKLPDGLLHRDAQRPALRRRAAGPERHLRAARRRAAQARRSARATCRTSPATACASSCARPPT